MMESTGAQVPAQAQAPKQQLQGLFEAYPHGTLAAMASGAGVLAVFTLGLEIVTHQWLARAVDLGVPFLSMPLGVATMVLAGLMSRTRVLYALPAVLCGVVYWGVFAAMVF